MMPDIRVIDAEPVGPDVVAKLEQVLELAREGKLSSVAIATVERDGCVNRSWSSAPSISLLIGSVARLQAALILTADCGE
jgi:hypothetical protein